MPEEKFQFIGQSGQFSQDTQATNKVVRAHVMRRYRRQQKKKQPVSPPGNINTGLRRGSGTTVSSDPWPQPSPGSVAADFVTSEDPIPDSAAAYQSDSPLSVQTWLDGELDPFSSLPVAADSRSLMLLHQNANSFIRTSVHSDPSETYRSVCSKNPAWLFMHLFYAASRFSKALGDSSSVAPYYLLQSISAINKSITTSPEMIDDATIATVACIANVENLNGRASNSIIHINGLRQMVQMRGGLENLGMRGILRRMVLWSDLLASLNSRTAPYFPAYNTEKPFQLWQFTPVDSRDKYRLTLNKSWAKITTRKHQVNIYELLLSLHELSTFLNLIGNRPLPWDAYYPDRVYEVEYCILLSQFDDSLVTELDATAGIGQLLLHAALLFIYTNLRETPVGGRIRRKLLFRLTCALDCIDLSFHSQTFCPEILWALLIGALAATDQGQTDLLNAAKGICIENGIHTWTEVMEQLKAMPSLVESCMVKCMNLWMDP
ncbi:unnamed protein product [Clonostachys rosea f. rosea IK726]|uniref:Transcription factor domain-containing protein n=2 Tax=Bionectria ochroleuca TaxID=29856 RepID=A0A0B7KEA9_BIOOC|nr:unnamed protein product [Clonostachys rosea f. rosea IK726]